MARRRDKNYRGAGIRESIMVLFKNINLVKVECAFCKKDFFRSRGQSNEAQKFGWKQYCSPDCISADRIKRQIFSCENCGKKFERSFHEISLHNYCSQSCAAVVNNKNCRKRKAKPKTCPICQKQLTDRGRRYCSKRCKTRALRSYTPRDLLRIIKSNARELKRIPTKREMREIASICVHSFGSWNNAIVTAGLEPNRSHNQRMYKCMRTRASDGHICDSVSELIIDNWLTENNIAHDRNISYPNTNHKADWGINFQERTIFVEYFGLAKDSPRYDKSVEEKKDICRKQKIQLIEIYPENLYFRAHVDRERLKEKFKYLLTCRGAGIRTQRISPSRRVHVTVTPRPDVSRENF